MPDPIRTAPPAPTTYRAVLSLYVPSDLTEYVPP